MSVPTEYIIAVMMAGLLACEASFWPVFNMEKEFLLPQSPLPLMSLYRPMLLIGCIGVTGGTLMLLLG